VRPDACSGSVVPGRPAFPGKRVGVLLCGAGTLPSGRVAPGIVVPQAGDPCAAWIVAGRELDRPRLRASGGTRTDHSARVVARRRPRCRGPRWLG
jgi:hypothetical protein